MSLLANCLALNTATHCKDSIYVHANATVYYNYFWLKEKNCKQYFYDSSFRLNSNMFYVSE